MHNATLIAISKPVIEGVPDTASLLAYCARVSSTANQMNHETGPKLLRSLIRRKEWSPLEMVSMTVEILTTRDIARQILRHRSFSFQEFSQRYAVVDSESVYRNWRKQDEKDRQKSIPMSSDALENYMWLDKQKKVQEAVGEAYQYALSVGIAKEVARTVLPEGMTASRLYVQGTLRSWIHYVGLRNDDKTQLEHRMVAASVAAIIAEQFPDLADLLGGV